MVAIAAAAQRDNDIAAAFTRKNILVSLFEMGRMSTVNDASVFAAVGRQMSENGTATLQGVVAATRISIGSLYHRYGSREGLLARTWLDAVRAFQIRFLKAIETEDENAGERAALITPQFCRAESERAIVLACCRRSEFLSDETPTVLRVAIRDVNKEADAALRRYAKRTGCSLRACRLGVVAFPLGAVRLYLPEHPVPQAIDTYVVEAFRSAMRADVAMRHGSYRS
jgi:AcrR family transcriptional regulator